VLRPAARLIWFGGDYGFQDADEESKGKRMRAVVWHGIGDIRLDSVPDPSLIDPTDAIVRITRSAICGTDLHMVRGTFSGMNEGTILGH
jgi:D-arabinose 1-dehydrogenase-like Zn-dependent alcohol dehydrogenase